VTHNINYGNGLGSTQRRMGPTWDGDNALVASGMFAVGDRSGDLPYRAVAPPSLVNWICIVTLSQGRPFSFGMPRGRRLMVATRLEKSLKRELDIDGKAYMLTIAPDGLKLVEKGRRKGLELAWKDVVSGDAALAAALNASVGKSTG